MSVSDPLLKDLKVAFQPFVAKSAIEDADINLLIFCETLEKIFYKGMTLHGDHLPPPWSWLDAVAYEMDHGRFPRVFSYIRSIDYCRNCKKITTSLGRFRLLIRCCLLYKCLHVPVEIMVREIGDRRFHWYQPHSVLGHDVLGEILLSVLLQASQLNFNLDISNARLLDISWCIPESSIITFVPCPSLGLTMSFVQSVSVVVRVEPGSVTEEENKIEPGDILDEVNEHILSDDHRGKLRSILGRLRKQPITLRILKTHYSKPHNTHPALIKLIQIAPHIAVDLGESSTKWQKTKEKAHRSHTGYRVSYLGSFESGKKGDITMIEAGIRNVVVLQTQPRPVTMQFRELEVFVLKDQQIFMHHPFMAIASCGHSVHFPKHFAYMVGNKECTSASEFTCHVFIADCEDICASVLLSLGYGFQRTHCAV